MFSSLLYWAGSFITIKYYTPLLAPGAALVGADEEKQAEKEALVVAKAAREDPVVQGQPLSRGS